MRNVAMFKNNQFLDPISPVFMVTFVKIIRELVKIVGFAETGF